LLLRKKELVKIKVKGTEKGIAIIPIRIFETDRGFLKIEIALGQGKKAFDKRESIKERDVERNLRRLEN
jgi:SsrA-binding protein